ALDPAAHVCRIHNWGGSHQIKVSGRGRGLGDSGAGRGYCPCCRRMQGFAEAPCLGRKGQRAHHQGKRKHCSSRCGHAVPQAASFVVPNTAGPGPTGEPKGNLCQLCRNQNRAAKYFGCSPDSAGIQAAERPSTTQLST
ncbi:hypothetical protein HDU91_003582, partial [Kappamyces sp. JEL0680]